MSRRRVLAAVGFAVTLLASLLSLPAAVSAQTALGYADQQSRLEAAADGGYVRDGTGAVPTEKITGRSMTGLGAATRWDTAQHVGQFARGDTDVSARTSVESRSSGARASVDPTFAQVFKGESHTCALGTNGVVVCWGSNRYGQLDVPSGSFTSVSGGWQHTCGLKTDATVACWGNNSVDQLEVPANTTFISVSANRWHTCGVKSDGRPKCWGWGDASLTTYPSGQFTSVAAGWEHVCGLKTDGTVACWGSNKQGQKNAPSGEFTSISSGWQHSCGVRTAYTEIVDGNSVMVSAGTVECWGNSGDGRATPPTETVDLFTSVAAGDKHTCGLRTNGTIKCWGKNDFGLTNGPMDPADTFISLASGALHSCGVRTDGTVSCWGCNTSEQAKALTRAALATNSAPEFGGATASREVAENTSSGPVGDPITASDPEGDRLTYSVAATSDADAADQLSAFMDDFELVTTSGQVVVKSGASIDYEDRETYKVLVHVTDGVNRYDNPDTTPDDTVTLTIWVTDVEEPGAVTISGTLRVGEVLTAGVTDPDRGVVSVTWVWSRASSSAGPFATIPGETASTYTLTDDDEPKYVRAAATYTDRRSPGKNANATRGPVLPAPDANSAPVFTDGASAAREVAENTSSGSNVGLPITASDAEGDALTYSVAATSGGTADFTAFGEDFELDTSSGQVVVKSGASIDYEDRQTYEVLVQVTDGKDPFDGVDTTTIDDTVTLTIRVTDVEEPGAVTISGTLRVGEVLTAGVTDPDRGVVSVTWVWSRASSSAGSFTPIPGETASTYTLTDDDDDKYVRATATYTDRRSPGKNANATRGPVLPAPATNSAGGGGGGSDVVGFDIDAGVATFVVANGWSPADVGVASVLAASIDNAVVLYTQAGVLSSQVAALTRAAAPAEVIIVGGAAAVSDDVQTRLAAASPESDIGRAAGADRTDTAAVAARRVLGVPARAGRVTLVIANGWSSPDIGAAAALAAGSGRAAVLYTRVDELPEASTAVLRDYQVARVIVVGGTAAIDQDVAEEIAAATDVGASMTRLNGADRVDTAALAARQVLGRPAAAPEGVTLVIANGWSPPDVGCAAALAAATGNAAVSYTEPGTLSDAAAALIREYRPTEVIIVGGAAAVTDDVSTAIAKLVADGATVRRIDGIDRIDTSAGAARRILRR